MILKFYVGHKGYHYIDDVKEVWFGYGGTGTINLTKPDGEWTRVDDRHMLFFGWKSDELPILVRRVFFKKADGIERMALYRHRSFLLNNNGDTIDVLERP